MIHVIDLDGTLLDIEQRYCSVHVEMCVWEGICPLERRKYWDLRREGMSERDVLRDAYGVHDLALIERFMRQRSLLLEATRYLEMDRPFPQWEKAINVLRETGSCILLTKRKSEKLLRQQLRWLGMDGAFHSIEVATDKAACLLHYRQAGEVGLITDWVDDVAAARAAGVGLVAVSSGLSSPRLLVSSGARVVVPGILEAAERIAQAGYGLAGPPETHTDAFSRCSP